MAQSIVLLEKDPGVAQSLAGGLEDHFSVNVTGTHEQLRDNVALNRPQAVSLSLEHWPLTDVERLHDEFPHVAIVCTHRIPDEEMWMAALSAGACDRCPPDHVSNVLISILRSTAVSR